MNATLALEICKLYGLGRTVNTATRVTGGLIHTMWLLETTNGRYAVKQLNEQIMSKPHILESFEMSESIAARFVEHGVPAVISLKNGERHVSKLGNIYVIVYPWIEGKILPNTAVSESQAYAIGKTIGKIHRINMLPEDNSISNILTVFSNSHWQELVQGLSAQFPSITVPLDQIATMNSEADQINKSLRKRMLTSHSDMDQKNVLWVADQPQIIDWESVGPTNPGLEIVEAALNWGGIVSGELNENSMRAVISGYRYIMPNFTYQPEYLKSVHIKWLTWLEFNIRRTQSTAPELKDMGLEQVKSTLNIINLISKHFEHIQTTISM